MAMLVEDTEVVSTSLAHRPDRCRLWEFFHRQQTCLKQEVHHLRSLVRPVDWQHLLLADRPAVPRHDP